MRLTSSDRLGLCVLLAVIAVAVGVRYAWTRHKADDVDTALLEATRRNAAALDSLWQAEDAVARAARREQQSAELFPFDPNTADSATLVRLGLRPWQVRNLMKYRRKGGRWRDAAHFAQLYGLTRTQYERLRPYLRIAPEEMAADVYGRGERGDLRRADSLHALRTPKLPAGSTVDANAADTALLKQIPGIGSYYARRIVDYRERLGGYIAAAQVGEAHENLPPDIAAWFVVSQPAKVRRLNVNKATFGELVRHPYLSYEQVKEIFRYRQTDGELRSWDDLRLSEVFAAADFERLAPYTEF